MSSTFLYLAIVAVWAVVLVPMWLRRDNDAAGISRLLARRPVSSHDHDDLPVEPELVHGADHHVGPEPGAADHAGAGGARGAADGGAGADAGTDLPYARLLDEEADPDLSRAAGRHRRNSRAAVIARRRRRTFGLTVLLAGVSIVAGLGLAPWWVTLPPAGLLTGHLALLRVAVGMDATRQRALRIERARLRAERERAEADAREREEAARAQIIDLAERARARDIFDQYAEDRHRGEKGAPVNGDRRAVGD